MISSRIFQDKLLLVLCSAIHWKKSPGNIFVTFFSFVFIEHEQLCFCLLNCRKWMSLVERMNIMELSLVASFDELRRCQDVLTDGTAEVGECVSDRDRRCINISLFSDSILTATCSVFFEIARISSISSNYWRESFAMASHHGWSTTVAAWTGQVRTGTFRFWDKIVSCTSFARNWEQSQTCRGNGTWSLGESWKFYHFIEGKSIEID